MDIKEGPVVPAAHRLREYWFPAVLAAVIFLAGTAPYFYAYWSTPPGERFMGVVGRGTPGANGYFMFSRQAQEGFQLMENQCTPEPLPRTFFNLEWWSLGKIARWTGLSLIMVFHLERLVAVFGLLFSVYYLASLSLDTVYQRRLAVALIGLGSGLGWTIWVANHGLGMSLIIPRDLKGVCISGYLINKPHFIRAVICAVLKYAFLLQGARTGKTRYFVYSGLMALTHSAMQPYHIPDTYLVYAAYPVLLNVRAGSWSWARFKNYMVAGAVFSPAVLYYAWMAYDGTLGMSGWERKPGFLIEYVFWIGWTFLAVAAVFPWLMRLRTAKDSTLLLGLWILAAWLMCNLYPYWGAGQEAAFYPFHVVPPILAVGGPLAWGIGALRRRPAWAVVTRRTALAAGVALVGVSMPSTAIVYAQMFTTAHSGTPDWTYYLDEDYFRTLEWLHAHDSSNGVVLASPAGSQFVFRMTRHKTVTGHDMLTARYEEKNALVHRFYSQAGDEAFKQEFVRRFSVRYVLYGDLERRLGAFTPDAYAWLRPVHTQGSTVLYAVEPGGKSDAPNP